MKEAILFRDDGVPRKISAYDVKNGIYSRNEEFIDPEYQEFKVQYVSGAKNNGGPYFRLYYSYEEYKRLFPDRADRYEIVANMKHFEESKWHWRWKENVSSFCTIEKYIKDPTIDRYKFADAFCEENRTCVEFQHSYINWDFEERNDFYSHLSIDTIWLYDLPNAHARMNEDGNIEILEDNARGFFKISENPNNLKNNRVYIQVKSGMIYRVNELFRCQSSTELKSTIRYFKLTEVYTEEEFIDAIKNNSFHAALIDEAQPKSIEKLWNNNYSWMIVRNVENNDLIRVNRNHLGEIFRDFSTGCIKYVYVDDKYGLSQSYQNKKEYNLSHRSEKSQIWIFIDAK